MHEDAADAPATLAHLLQQAEQAGASDVHLHRTRDGAEVAFRLDGVLTPVSTLPPALAERVFGRIKYLARLKTYDDSLPRTAAWTAPTPAPRGTFAWRRTPP
jgi:type II secretory ATPase GspE/PulE/Tfp pilus assembly ATPase PilB-like protein